MDVTTALQIASGIGGLGGTGLGTYVVIRWLHGDLVSLREHQETREDRDKAEAALEEARVTIRELIEQNAKLVAASQVAVEVAKHLPDAAHRVRQEGGDHAQP